VSTKATYAKFAPNIFIKKNRRLSTNTPVAVNYSDNLAMQSPAIGTPSSSAEGREFSAQRERPRMANRPVRTGAMSRAGAELRYA
jgi:hypothetical protein